MTLVELSSIAGGVIVVGGTGITIFKKSVINPLIEKINSLNSLYSDLKKEVEKNKKDSDDNWKINSIADQKLREEFIELKAKHDQAIDKIDDMKSVMTNGFDKLFAFMEKRQETESLLAQKVAGLEQKIKNDG